MRLSGSGNNNSVLATVRSKLMLVLVLVRMKSPIPANVRYSLPSQFGSGGPARTASPGPRVRGFVKDRHHGVHHHRAVLAPPRVWGVLLDGWGARTAPGRPVGPYLCIASLPPRPHFWRGSASLPVDELSRHLRLSPCRSTHTYVPRVTLGGRSPKDRSKTTDAVAR